MAEQIRDCCGHSKGGSSPSGDLWEATVLGIHSQDLVSQPRTPVHPQGQTSGKRTDAKRRVRTPGTHQAAQLPMTKTSEEEAK